MVGLAWEDGVNKALTNKQYEQGVGILEGMAEEPYIIDKIMPKLSL